MKFESIRLRDLRSFKDAEKRLAGMCCKGAKLSCSPALIVWAF